MVSKLSQCVARMRAGAPMGRFPVSLSAGSLFHPHRVMDDPDQNSSHFIHSRPHWRKCINYLSSLHSHSKKWWISAFYIRFLFLVLWRRRLVFNMLGECLRLELRVILTRRNAMVGLSTELVRIRNRLKCKSKSYETNSTLRCFDLINW